MASTVVTRPIFHSVEQTVGVRVSRSALKSQTLPSFTEADAHEKIVDEQQNIEADAEVDAQHVTRPVHAEADGDVSAVACSGTAPDAHHAALNMQETAVVNFSDTKGAEKWLECRIRPPPSDSMLSKLREHASCADSGVEPNRPFPHNACTEEAAAGQHGAPTSHCAVVLSVMRSGSRCQAQKAEV